MSHHVTSHKSPSHSKQACDAAWSPDFSHLGPRFFITMHSSQVWYLLPAQLSSLIHQSHHKNKWCCRRQSNLSMIFCIVFDTKQNDTKKHLYMTRFLKLIENTIKLLCLVKSGLRMIHGRCHCDPNEQRWLASPSQIFASIIAMDSFRLVVDCRFGFQYLVLGVAGYYVKFFRVVSL